MSKRENNVSYLPLIAQWEEYIASHKEITMHDFGMWLIKKEDSQMVDEVLYDYFDQKAIENNYSHRSSEAAFLIWRLGKFVRFYTRPALIENGLASQDDFAILAHIDYKNTCSKREAIDANIIEPTTGIEIIRRLIRLGYISEKSNKDDKRQKLVSLTEYGRTKLYAIYESFRTIEDVMGELTTPQREELFTALKVLDDYHTINHKSLLKKK